MAEVRTIPVNAVRVDDLDAVTHKPGMFEYQFGKGDFPIAMAFVCPCGCGHVGHLAFEPDPSPSWQWDGNLEKPTLSPSVWQPGHWHGWLRAGVWESV